MQFGEGVQDLAAKNCMQFGGGGGFGADESAH